MIYFSGRYVQSHHPSSTYSYPAKNRNRNKKKKKIANLDKKKPTHRKSPSAARGQLRRQEGQFANPSWCSLSWGFVMSFHRDCSARPVVHAETGRSADRKNKDREYTWTSYYPYCRLLYAWLRTAAEMALMIGYAFSLSLSLYSSLYIW